MPLFPPNSSRISLRPFPPSSLPPHRFSGGLKRLDGRAEPIGRHRKILDKIANISPILSPVVRLGSAIPPPLVVGSHALARHGTAVSYVLRDVQGLRDLDKASFFTFFPYFIYFPVCVAVSR